MLFTLVVLLKTIDTYCLHVLRKWRYASCVLKSANAVFTCILCRVRSLLGRARKAEGVCMHTLWVNIEIKHVR